MKWLALFEWLGVAVLIAMAVYYHNHYVAV